jgi:hypothetical protein
MKNTTIQNARGKRVQQNSVTKRERPASNALRAPVAAIVSEFRCAAKASQNQAFHACVLS